MTPLKLTCVSSLPVHSRALKKTCLEDSKNTTNPFVSTIIHAWKMRVIFGQIVDECMGMIPCLISTHFHVIRFFRSCISHD